MAFSLEGICELLECVCMRERAFMGWGGVRLWGLVLIEIREKKMVIFLVF